MFEILAEAKKEDKKKESKKKTSKKKATKKKTAKKSSKKAEDATIDYTPSDVDENPESPMNDDTTKMKVPGEVKKAIKDEATQLRKEADNIKNRDKDRSEFYTDVADALEEINKCLDIGTVESFKKAQVFMSSLMGPITQRIPNVAYKFLTGSTEPTSLKDLFTQVKNKKK